MSRIGDIVLAIQTGGANTSFTAISTKQPVLGQKCIIIPDGAGGNIAIKPFNVYEQDEGISMPLPCGANAFLAGDPPNYLPSSWESGVTVSAIQGVPQTWGWFCNEGCTYHPVFNPCARGDAGGGVNDRDAWFCQNTNAPRQYAYRYWQQNRTNHDPVYKLSCRTDCPSKCGNYPYSGTSIPMGCIRPMQYLNRTEISPGYTTYGCTGGAGTCPNYRGGAGTRKCNVSPPEYAPGPKPGTCRLHQFLEFLGWTVPGATGSVSTICVLNKATEGVRSTSDDNITCVFSRR